MTATAATDAPYLRGMKRLVVVVQELSLARDLPTVQHIVRHAARELTGADGATFILRDGDRCFYADEDAIAPLWKGQRFPMSACISGWTMLHREAAVIEDIYLDNRIPHDAYRPTFVKSLACVPIRTLDPIGAIGNYWAATRKPAPYEVELLKALADTTAVALENVRVYQELEARVAQRTAALAASNKELESFSHSVSHDLQSPVRAIAGFCRLLEKNHAAQLDGEAQRKLGVIGSESERMERLIKGLLEFSRIGFKALKPQRLDMTAMARGVFERLREQRPEAEQAMIDFRLPALPVVEADPTLLEQVWTNLLSNAIKFSSRTPQPVIEIAVRDEGGEHVYSVRDNGVGFDPRYADKLFGTFQRLHTEQEFPGTGVGLSLVRRIVARHGGRTGADGRPGEGATFFFSLPRIGAAVGPTVLRAFAAAG